MKTFKKKSSVPLNRLFLRILLFFLSFLIPILIIGAIFYINTTNRLKEEFTQKIEANLQSSVRTIDIYLNAAQSTSGNFFYDVRAIMKPYDQYSPEERLDLLKITEAISRIGNNLIQIIDKIFVYADDKKVFKQDGLEDFNNFFDNYAFDGYDLGTWKDKLINGSSLEIMEPSEVTVNAMKHKRVIPFLFTSVLNGHKAVMVYTIQTDIIDKTLRDHTVIDSTDFIVLDSHNKVVMSSKERLAEPAVTSQVENLFRSGSQPYGEIKLNGANYVMTQVESDNYGWRYFSMTPVTEFSKQTSYFLVSLLTTCFVLVVVGIVFSFIFTFNLYNPIKRIRDILDHPEDTEERGAGKPDSHTAFDFIGIRINRLIEHNHQFKHELETVSVGYLEQSLLNLIHGNKAVNGQEIGKMLRNHVSFSKPSFLCCIIRFEFKEAFYQDIQDVERLNILSKMKKILWGLLRAYANIYMLEEHDNLYIGIVNLQDGEEAEPIRKGLQTIIDTFRYDSRYCFIYIGMGKGYEGIQGIAASYADALNALESADGMTDFQMIDAASIARPPMHYSYSFMDENGIINCLKACDMDNLRLKVDDIVEKNKEKGIPRHLISALLDEIYNTGCRFLAERGINPQELMEPGKMRSLSNHEEQRLLVLAFFKLIMERISTQDQDSFGEISSIIIEYIEENYHHDLGLEKISGEMGVSSKYISRVFKEKTGENLIGYVSKYRISKAKELLVETDLNVNEISERVGIYSRTTFIRLFKKYEATTPLLYRNASRRK